MIETGLQVGEEEYSFLVELNLNSKAFKNRRRILAVIEIAAALYMLFLGIQMIFVQVRLFNVLCLLLAVFFLYLAFGGIKKIQRKSLMKQAQKLNAEMNAGTRKYIFSAEGVKLSSNLGDSDYKWSAFTCYLVKSHYLVMRRIDNQYVLVDLSVLTQENKGQLLKWLNENCIPKVEEV